MLKLNVYAGRKLVKTYEADTYSLLFGTVEDVAAAINLDGFNTGSDVETFKVIADFATRNMPMVHDLMKEIFEDITDDDIRHARASDIGAVLIDVVRYTISEMKKLGGNQKN